MYKLYTYAFYNANVCRGKELSWLNIPFQICCRGVLGWVSFSVWKLRGSLVVSEESPLGKVTVSATNTSATTCFLPKVLIYSSQLDTHDYTCMYVCMYVCMIYIYIYMIYKVLHSYADKCHGGPPLNKYGILICFPRSNFWRGIQDDQPNSRFCLLPIYI